MKKEKFVCWGCEDRKKGTYNVVDIYSCGTKVCAICGQKTEGKDTDIIHTKMLSPYIERK